MHLPNKPNTDGVKLHEWVGKHDNDNGTLHWTPGRYGSRAAQVMDRCTSRQSRGQPDGNVPSVPMVSRGQDDYHGTGSLTSTDLPVVSELIRSQRDAVIGSPYPAVVRDVGG